MVRYEFFESGISNKIIELLEHSLKADIAVAYLRSGGYLQIEDALEEFLCRRKTMLRILCGVGGFNITQPEPLKDLYAKIAKYGPKKLKLKIWKGAKFHPKVYIFQKWQRASIIVGSSNLTGGGIGEGNIEANVLIQGNLKDPIIHDIREFFKTIWNEGKPVRRRYLRTLQDTEKNQTDKISVLRKFEEKLDVPESKHQPQFVPEEKVKIEAESHPVVDPDAMENVITLINYSPEKYERVCRDKEGNKKYCNNESFKWCIKRPKNEGCASSKIFRDYKFYVLSPDAFRKERCHFFFARNPNLDGEYYIVGFLYMKRKVKPPYYESDEKLSLRFDDKGPGVVPFDKKLADKLPSLGIDWNTPRAKKRKTDASVIGWYHGNPIYLSNMDAVAILREYLIRPYPRENKQKVRRIIARYERL